MSSYIQYTLCPKRYVRQRDYNKHMANKHPIPPTTKKSVTKQQTETTYSTISTPRFIAP